MLNNGMNGGPLPSSRHASFLPSSLLSLYRLASVLSSVSRARLLSSSCFVASPIHNKPFGTCDHTFMPPIFRLFNSPCLSVAVEIQGAVCDWVALLRMPQWKQYYDAVMWIQVRPWPRCSSFVQNCLFSDEKCSALANSSTPILHWLGWTSKLTRLCNKFCLATLTASEGSN